MNILSICDGHNSSVALSQNGIIKFAISEERLVREKNFFGWPAFSLKYIDDNFIKIKDLDLVVMYREDVADYLAFLIPEHIDDASKKRLWKKTITRISLRMRKFLNFNFFKRKLIKYYADKLQINKDRVILLNHHKSHAVAAFSEIDLTHDWLHFVFDAEGDGVSASVFRSKKDNLVLLTNTDRYNSLGHFYSQITSFLGMKPNQHEFKVMGLEPYADRNSNGFKSCYKKFKKIIIVNNGVAKFMVSPTTRKFGSFLKKNFSYERFDNIAAAAQVILEDTIIELVSYWVKKVGIKKVSFSGGVAMNVKLMQLIYEQEFIEEIYVVPSSGDESCVIGGCNHGNLISGIPLKQLNNLYLGVIRNFNNEIEQIKKKEKSLIFEYILDINECVSELLFQGNVVARVCGRDEFGARALGNRSILANPYKGEVIDLINKQVKNRDFWMPFTPSILNDYRDELVYNPKKFNAHYMNITFHSTSFAKDKMPAALHPWDKTVRPQFVTMTHNKDYYELIQKFNKKSGIPALLNTSYNLHGDPNVSSASDAIEAFKKSGLKFLQIENFLIKKN